MSFREYVEFGWKLCALEKRQKGPTYPNWQLNPIDAEIADGIDGAGLLHALSGTACLDIDRLDIARDWLANRGVDLDGLLEAKDAVQISSGTPNRAKLLFKMKIPLRTFKPANSGLELRCATLSGTSTQDVLPPSVHPSGRKYEWKFGEPLLGDWSSLPAIPAALKAAWRTLIAEEPELPKTNGDMDVALDKLHKWIVHQDPNMEYDDWYKVGAKLHHATHGAEEGLEIWKDWSAKATRNQHGKDSPVQANANCRAHWLSFSSPKGKILATLDNEIPADADEFEIIAEEPKAASDSRPIEKKVREAAIQQRKDAISALEAKVVYVVNSEKYFDMERHRLIGSEAALEHLFTSSMPLGKNGRMNPVKILKSSTSKRLVEALGFHPGEGALFTAGGDTFANLYRNRLPKPLEPTVDERKRIDWLFDRIDDPIYSRWLKQYYAHVVQQPGTKLKSAPLLWSETQRNGKTTLLKAIPSLLVGMEYSADVSYEMLNHPHNDYLVGIWHVNLTEFRAGSRGERTMVNNKLKAYIADDMIPLHPKGTRGYTMPNHFFVTASSNEEDAAAIDNNDERWGVHEFKQPKFTDSERKWIYYQFLLLPRAAAVLRHYFLHISLEGFFPAGSAPMTEDKQDMADASMSSDKELLLLMFEEHAQMFSRDIVITSEVMAHVHKHSPMRPSANRIGKILTSAPFNGVAIQFRAGQGRYRGVVIRNHQKWISATGRTLMDHVSGDDDIEVDLMA